MSPRTVHARTGRLVAAAIVIVALAALVLGGLGKVTVRTYALQAPNQFPLVTLGPRHTACEGPVSSPRPFRALAIWGAGVGGPATLRLSVRAPGHGAGLAAGTTRARNAEAEQRITLDATVTGGIPVRVCVTDEQGQFSLAGSQAVHPDIVMSGRPTGREFSLLLLSTGQSLFSALPMAFSRAALFRPGWVGTWTFWVLAGGLLAAFALACLALTRALAADAEHEHGVPEADRGRPDAGPAGSA